MDLLVIMLCMPTERKLCDDTAGTLTAHDYDFIVMDAVIGDPSGGSLKFADGWSINHVGKRIHKSLTTGERGIIRSWEKAFTIAVRLNVSHLIVLESDTQATARFPGVHADFDVVQLHMRPPKWGKEPEGCGRSRGDGMDENWTGQQTSISTCCVGSSRSNHSDQIQGCCAAARDATRYFDNEVTLRRERRLSEQKKNPWTTPQTRTQPATATGPWITGGWGRGKTTRAYRRLRCSG